MATIGNLETDMKEVGFEIVRTSVRTGNGLTDLLDQYNEAKRSGNMPEYFELPEKQRTLKGEYTVEMMEDLKAMHGVDAEAELINLMKLEIQMEQDKELLSKLTNNRI